MTHASTTGAAPLPAENSVSRFGRSMLPQWCLDPQVTYLNHGTVGATPRRVLAAQQALRDAIETQPSRFLLRELTGHLGMSPPESSRMRVAATAIAAFIGARGEDLVFVDNATAGVNAVLRSFDFRTGDEILVTDHGYGAITYTAQYVARERGCSVRTVELPFPVAAPEAITAAIEAAIGPRTRVAIIDHVTSGSALVLPIAEIAALCRARGVALLADGAHAPGALPLEVSAIGAAWYTGNLHKWAWAPRSCGILWAEPARQAALHPPVISWGLDQGYSKEFDWVGTRDPSPWLAAPEAIAMLGDLGASAVRDYNRLLAIEAARLLRDRLGAEIMAPDSMLGTMTTVRLPARFGTTLDDAARLRNALLMSDSIEIQVHAWQSRVWVRTSAQIYNDASDIDRLVRALSRWSPS